MGPACWAHGVVVPKWPDPIKKRMDARHPQDTRPCPLLAPKAAEQCTTEERRGGPPGGLSCVYRASVFAFRPGELHEPRTAGNTIGIRSDCVEGAFDAIRMMEVSRACYAFHGVEAPPLDSAVEAVMKARRENKTVGTSTGGGMEGQGLEATPETT